MSPTRNQISRRKFIYNTGCAALGSTTLLSSLINLQAIGAAFADKRAVPARSGEYKALVCILLSGGADSHNILIPKGVAEHGAYEITRSNLAIPRGEVLALNHNGQEGRKYGLHPGMPKVQQLFNEGKAAFVANVGTLLEPLSTEQFQNRSVPLPLGLFSHSDQVMHWQTGRPGERNSHGWAGRMADLIGSQNTNENISMNISLNGRNNFQSGANSVEFSVKSNGNVGINGYASESDYYSLRNAAIDNMLDAQYQDLFEKTYIETLTKSKDGSVQFIEALDQLEPFTTTFSDTNLSARMHMVAKVIAIREALGFERQTFFINYGGWDNHDQVLENQAAKLPELDDALAEFNAAINELGVQDGVTTFTISDFARTLTSNGNGSDHAWGGNMMVMGGKVNGGEIYGTYPMLEEGSEFMLNRGRVIPTTSVAEYIAELALWFGVSPGDVSEILPDLVNFYDVNSGGQPIGFMNING